MHSLSQTVRFLTIARPPQLMLMHKGKGLPLLALASEIRALINISWSRLHLHKSYWTEGA